MLRPTPNRRAASRRDPCASSSKWRSNTRSDTPCMAGSRVATARRSTGDDRSARLIGPGTVPFSTGGSAQFSTGANTPRRMRSPRTASRGHHESPEAASFVHGSNLSNIGASGNPGAVQFQVLQYPQALSWRDDMRSRAVSNQRAGNAAQPWAAVRRRPVQPERHRDRRAGCQEWTAPEAAADPLPAARKSASSAACGFPHLPPQ